MYKCYFYIVHQGVKMGTNSIFCHNDLKIKNIVQQVLKYAQSLVFLKSMRSYMCMFQVKCYINIGQEVLSKQNGNGKLTNIK